MKFLADMPVSPRTADFLRRKGHDAVHLRERGMQKATDEEVLKLAVKEGRVILTMDLDFPHLMALGICPYLPSSYSVWKTSVLIISISC